MNANPSSRRVVHSASISQDRICGCVGQFEASFPAHSYVYSGSTLFWPTTHQVHPFSAVALNLMCLGSERMNGTPVGAGVVAFAPPRGLFLTTPMKISQHGICDTVSCQTLCHTIFPTSDMCSIFIFVLVKCSVSNWLPI